MVDLVLNLDTIIFMLEAGLVSSLAGISLSLIMVRLFGKRLKTTLIGWIDEYLGQLLTRVEENPQIIAKLMPSLLKGAGIEKSANPGSGTLNIMGFKVPMELVKQFLPMVVKGGVNAAEGKNPFE